MTADGKPFGESRKIVTVLFSDLVSSTVLGEELDPESFRALVSRYFQEMKAIVQRHGGTTAKFVGDAVLAVFGIPVLHEDDALRAVRAAVEMRDTLEQLNKEFERTWGVNVLARMGVNTGEVIAADPTGSEGVLVGDAVNVAARLEQSAEPGQILIGDATHRLVRDAATAEPLPPLRVKGKGEPLTAWQLVDVAPGLPGWGRRLDTPLVGREPELAALEEAFQRTVDDRSCRVLTVLGPAGAGKSRLTMEFLSRTAGGARIVGGRCLAYGEGITFWPIVEVLREAAGVGEFDAPEEARPKIMSLVEFASASSLIGQRLAALLGLSDTRPGIQETFWAIRKLFEELAARRPLVVVFDDVHWAEPTCLDLLEYLAGSIQEGPVLLLCMARPELLEVRGTWMGGKPDASLLTLQPLTEQESEGLIRTLLTGGEVPGIALARLAEFGEGNPLFVEEMVRMLLDDGVLRRDNGRWTLTRDISTLVIPPTIHALLTARLDRLEDEERAVLERAAVVGRVFWWGAVSELSPEEQRDRVGGHLQSLTRKELIRPDRSELAQEDAFRFTHILIRDAAYGGIPKADRADMHTKFAEWVERKTRERAGEYEEIVGYHLEQACRARAELATPPETLRSLGRRAAVPLGSAGRRAFERGDMPAAVNLLERAVSLLPSDDEDRLPLLPDLAFALLETGGFERMQQVVGEVSEGAERSGDPLLRAHAVIVRLWMRLFTDPEGWAEEAYREAVDAIKMFEERGYERGLARGWSLLGLVHILTCQFAAAEEAWEKAAAHARAFRSQREEFEYLSWIPLAAWGGPTPTADGIAKCHEVLDRAAGDRKAMSTALFVEAKFEAMRGRFDEARDLVVRGREILEEIALPVWLAGPMTQFAGWVELLAGDAVAAERTLRPGAEILREIGELSWLSTVAGLLGEALYVQGRDDEAEEFLKVCEETAGSEDAYSQGLLRTVRAKLLSRRGARREAEELGRRAVAITEPTDFLLLQAFVRLGLGEVLMQGDNQDEARAVLSEAEAISERKGFTVGAERARALLA